MRFLSTARRRALAPGPQVIQRSAGERREAGAEDEPGVREIGVGHDPFVDRLLRLGEVGLHHARDERLVDGGRLALDRLALLPAVETLAGLLPELAGLEQLLEPPRRRRVRTGQRLTGRG